MVDAACRPILLTRTGQIGHRGVPTVSIVVILLVLSSFPSPCPIGGRGAPHSQKHSLCDPSNLLTGNGGQSFKSKSPKRASCISRSFTGAQIHPRARKIHHGTPAWNQRPPSARPSETASNLTPSMPVSHSPRLACNMTRLHLNPSLHLACSASRSINQSIDQCLARNFYRLVAAHLSSALRVLVAQEQRTGWDASRAPPIRYHVDGNLAAKTRSNHPNGVVGVALGCSS